MNAVNKSAFKISSRTKKIVLFSTCYVIAARVVTFYVLSMSADVQIDISDLTPHSFEATAVSTDKVDAIRI